MRVILVSVGLAVALSAQAPRPAFEVASVKKLAERIPQSRARVRRTCGVPALYFANTSVAALVLFAYNLSPFELVGGPDWIRQDLFEINARAATEVSPDEKRLMLQSLLADRFKLVVRRDKQEMAFSQLVLARSDGRLGPNFTACPDPNAPEPRRIAPRGGQLWVINCGTIADLARAASIFLRAPAVDRTDVTGMWHIEVAFIDPRFALSAGGGAQTPPIDPNLTDISTAMREQLGLKLESTRGPVDVLVVESVAAADSGLTTKARRSRS